MTTEGFLLTRQWLEHDEQQDLVFWLASPDGPVRAIIESAPSVCFVATSAVNQLQRVLADVPYQTREVDLATFHLGLPVSACYFPTQRQLNIARGRMEASGITHYEADLRPTDRYLMERFIKSGVKVTGEFDLVDGVRRYTNPRIAPCDYLPELRVLSLDIETSYTEQVLYSIAAQTINTSCVFMVGDEDDSDLVTFCKSERQVISRFLDWLHDDDPDVIIGWSVIAFDLSFLQRRCEALGIPFTLGRDKQPVLWRTTTQDRTFAKVPGRVVLDGIELLRTATYSFESFSLEYVSRSLLGEGKKIENVDNRAGKIQDMFREDKAALAHYNLEDCRLVLDIFAVTGLLDFAIQRAALTGLDIDRMGASVAAFDYLYLPLLHRAGLVAPVVEEADTVASPGGFVLESKPGIYQNVIVLDFKSLYPSIIRTFHVDPLAMARPGDDPIPGYKGGTFARDGALLPDIIADLWQARDQAKLEGKSANSQAIKIIMNSFYGVLGTTGCRFFDARLASSITMRGHEILQTTRDVIEQQGYSVIYGDTDSVFVLIGAEVTDVSAVGDALATKLNRWWHDNVRETFNLPSYLEIEFETCFTRFLMPTVRGSEQGSKKRYAGMVQKKGVSELVFKGLETVRTDWSPLAREFQQELYRRVFNDLPYEQYVKDVVAGVRDGLLDDKLVLRKRLRRKLDEYTKNVPPHVRAAKIERQLQQTDQEVSWLSSGSRWVEYVMTVSGPEPANYRTSQPDYHFYVERQLAPVADAILGFKGTSLGELTDPQLGLF